MPFKTYLPSLSNFGSTYIPLPSSIKSAASHGRIVIDGVDISKIDLQDLRSRLGIIPQDPTLFQGTVLRKCRLDKMVRPDERGLDALVADDGENWSVGQRQFACLARILLKKRRILVLDEATTSIDTTTYIVILEIIREETSRLSSLHVFNHFHLDKCMTFYEMVDKLMTYARALVTGFEPESIGDWKRSFVKTQPSTNFDRGNKILNNVYLLL
ncbi:hypothetical protein ACFE04_026844 [Oxalis oulophora]